MSRYTRIVAITTLLAAAGPAAQAASGPANDATGVSSARVSLVQAVVAAERHVPGRASRAEYERTDDGWAYDVEVVDGQRVVDVRIDPANGAVIGSKPDAPDQDDALDGRD